MSATYIHYGHPSFNLEAFRTPGGSPPSKPVSGLWGSRTDSAYGWREWCKCQADDDEEYGYGDFSSSFEFKLAEKAHILEIHDEDSIMPFIIPYPNRNILYSHCRTSPLDSINFDMIKSDRFDGIELFMYENPLLHNGVFNTWDCDSIVVWNENAIIVM